MPAFALSFAAAEAVTLAVLAALVVIASILSYRAWKRTRISPEERERLRRESLVSRGKITDATLVEIREGAFFYSYLVRGVEYIASQDVTALGPYMPSELGLGVGSVAVKYDAKNPANSIVLAEKWSGLYASKVS
jgi:hypothetical protein